MIKEIQYQVYWKEIDVGFSNWENYKSLEEAQNFFNKLKCCEPHHEKSIIYELNKILVTIEDNEEVDEEHIEVIESFER